MTHADAETAARTHAAWIDRSDRHRLAVAGPDRARFLHNLTTNDVKALAEGQGCEAFVTSLQGKTLAFATLHAEADRILLRTEAVSAELLRPHFARYALFDDVQLDEVGEATAEIHLLGPEGGAVLTGLGIEPPDLADQGVAPAAIDGEPVTLIRESPAGLPGWTIVLPRERRERLVDRLGTLGAVLLPAVTFDALRIEAGTPLSGRDVLPENLPQELDRDARAISFRKGCYLGQETVARLDALGHVNKVWRGLIVEGDRVPPPGTPLVTDEGKPVGAVTSSAFSASRGGPIAAGFVRVKAGPIGTRLRLDGLDPEAFATVAALPLGPSTD